MNKNIQADNYFAIIPEWVLYAEISSNAVRLYGVLRRYADANGKCHPSRNTLAKQCRVSQPTLTKATEELISIGALTVRHRRSKDGDFTSNQYTVISVNPVGVLKNIAPPSKDFDTTGTKESSSQTIASLNQSQEPTGAVAVAREIASEWWDAQEVKPLGKRAWYSLNNVVKSAVERGFTKQQIMSVLNEVGSVPSIREMDSRLRRTRKPVTSQPTFTRRDSQLEDALTQVTNFVRLRTSRDDINDYILSRHERMHEELFAKLDELLPESA